MITRFEERSDHFAVFVMDDNRTPVLAVPINKSVPDADGKIYTTEGMVPADRLHRMVIFEDRAEELVVEVEWRRGDVLVKRDANVILKKGGVVADAIAANIG